ncbi:hypothetical protein ACFQT0_27240 [Hymenobacter humi]|uniref:Uncharacterized protein n=1 Tax=Hymenobacter humi TaxID=1411620 RepID=A0ABW2UAU5_9BACT
MRPHNVFPVGANKEKMHLRQRKAGLPEHLLSQILIQIASLIYPKINHFRLREGALHNGISRFLDDTERGWVAATHSKTQINGPAALLKI